MTENAVGGSGGKEPQEAAREWSVLEAAFIAGTSLRQLATLHGIPRRTLERQSRRLGWLGKRVKAVADISGVTAAARAEAQAPLSPLPPAAPKPKGPLVDHLASKITGLRNLTITTGKAMNEAMIALQDVRAMGLTQEAARLAESLTKRLAAAQRAYREACVDYERAMAQQQESGTGESLWEKLDRCYAMGGGPADQQAPPA